MLDTTTELYQATLDGIKKESTTTVTPAKWNRLINEGALVWLAEKTRAIELDQKKIDDLQVIRVVTDGLREFPSGITLYPLVTDTGSNYLFTLPVTATININNNQNTTQNYPKYYRLLNTMFKIMYVDNICDLIGVSDWLEAKIMRSDARVSTLKNPYREPRDDRLYYEIIDDKINLITGTSSYADSMRMEYLRMPIEIFFNSDNPADTGDPITGSVNCEFPEQQKQEIVDVAVREFLERVKDPRYRSFLQEEAIKSQSK